MPHFDMTKIDCQGCVRINIFIRYMSRYPIGAFGKTAFYQYPIVNNAGYTALAIKPFSKFVASYVIKHVLNIKPK